MKKGLYVVYIVLGIAVVVAAVIIGTTFKQKATNESIETAVKVSVDRQMKVLKKQQPNAFKGSQGRKAEKNYRKIVEEQVRINEMIKRDADSKGVKVSKKEIDAAIAKVENAYQGKVKFSEALKKQALTLKEYRDNVRDQILLSKMMAEVTKTIKVTETEAKTYYKSHRGEFKESFDKVTEEIKNRILQQKRQEKYAAYIEKLKSRLKKN